MKCARCQGLMVPDRFIDLEETGHLWMSGWRCMNCGHVVDSLPEHNRKLQAQSCVGVVTLPHKTKSLANVSVPVPEAEMSCSLERESPMVSTTGNESQAA